MDTNNIISATEVARSFSDIINKVYYQHQSYDVKKGKSIVARIVPCNYSSKIEVKDLNSFFANSPKLEDGDGSILIDELEALRTTAKAREIKWE
ncbi:MAG: antitoxin [Rickettsiales bacterium]